MAFPLPSLHTHPNCGLIEWFTKHLLASRNIDHHETIDSRASV